MHLFERDVIIFCRRYKYFEREDESDQNSNDSFESGENNEIDNNMEVEPWEINSTWNDH